MRVVVTGSGGMVGKNIIEDSRFQKMDLLTPNRKDVDLFKYDQVLNYFLKHKPEAIIHCAGRVGGIQANIANPVAFLIENLDVNRNVILAAKEAGIKKLVYLGSSCMYPREAPNPLKEDLILKGELEPTNEGYALAKIVGQRLCAYIRKENPEFLYKTLIPCNLYGRHDKFDPKSSHLVPAVIKKIHEAKMNNLDSVEIWGDGKARREFMYTADLVDCIYQTLQKIESAPDVMNVGLGVDYSVNEYYQEAAKVIGYKGQFKHDLTKPVGMKQKLTSTEVAQKWGWQNKTSLVEGLKQTYEYFLKL